MEISKQKILELNVPAGVAWNLARDIPAVAACLPGATITGGPDEVKYFGRVEVRVGPVSVNFNGVLEVKEIDEPGRKMTIVASGRDGASRASVEMKTSVSDTGNGKSRVEGHSLLHISGKLATLGGRMLNTVADKIIEEFATNFSKAATARAHLPGAVGENLYSHSASSVTPFNLLFLLANELKKWAKALVGLK